MQQQSQEIGPNNECYMDCHTHLLDYPEESQPHNVIENAMKNGVKHMVVNTTTTKQFNGLVKLMDQYGPTLLGGFGVHPCFVEEQERIQQAKNIQKQRTNQMPTQNGKYSWIQQLEAMLKKKESYSVGEIGLDFRKDVLEKNPKNIQMHYFTTQLELSLRLGRPATIHCVRAHGEMLKVLKELNKKIKEAQNRPHLIMHSYGGSEEITKSMLKLDRLNIFFSLSLKRSESLCSVIPLQNLICETDSPCQNSPTLLLDQNRLHLNTYLQRKTKLLKQNVIQPAINPETNEPVNVISNIKSLFKYYKMDEAKFANIIFNNSLRAFKLVK